jgi:PIN domain nuclease of toxin-antitoxin system
VEPFTAADALTAAALHPLTVSKGLSLGDRACLALAQRLGVAAMTADHARAELDVDIAVALIRPPAP